MSEKRTDKKKLMKGVKYLAASIPLAFIGPTSIFYGFGGREEVLYIIMLIFGFLAALAAGFLMFKGIKTVMRGIFND
ncbi:MAG TPA: DUF6095 family protein [Flavobacteriaceae bacterium]|nr:DUF6095 family protein [Flavobacteriaceae bacterium]